MYVTRLHARNLRRFDQVDIAPSPGLNLITGDNGAGKTSLLEALHLMAYGRSFRGRVRDGVVRSGAGAIEVFVEWRESTEPASHGWLRKAGMRHSGQEWTGRLDGEPVSHLGELCAALAVVTFEPGSHLLITGPAELRRRYLDWGLFHVEHDFIALWRRYSRALKQRNALLKARGSQQQLDAWDNELVEAGEPLSRGRQGYLDALQPGFQALVSELAPALGDVTLSFQPGWRRDEMSLADALLFGRDRDLALGYSSLGPHRSDWRIGFTGVPGREALSRGQTKLTALAAILAQAEYHASARGDWPVVALDDLASELDRIHQGRVLSRLLRTPAQVWLTGTELPPALADMAPRFDRFHVEQGTVSQISAA